MVPKYTPATMKKKKKKTNKRVVKEYNPLPPEPLESKLDKEMAEGEYFVSNKLKKKEISKEEQKLRSIKRQREKRDKQYVVPEETVHKKRKADDVTESGEVDVDKLKKKIKLQKKKLAGKSSSVVTTAQKSEDKTKKDKKKKHSS